MSSYSFTPILPLSQTTHGPNLFPVKHVQIITLTSVLLNVFFTYF